MKLFKICSSVFLLISLCATGYADEHFPFLAQVAKKSVNIRAGANTNFEKLDQLGEGDEVVVLAKSFDWYKVQLPLTSKVFVRADYLKVNPNSMGELIGDKVNIRAAANSESASVGMIKKGDAVKLISEVNGWWQVEPPVQAVGWIRQDFLTVKLANPDPSLLKASVKSKQPVESSSLTVIEVRGLLKVTPQTKAGIHYELIKDDQTIYYVQSVPNLDCFKDAKVSIKGFIVSDPTHVNEHDVLQAANVSLLL